ncbi:MAG: hypothetical protein HUJ56_11140 [Erysipelotrichaceae bacterium]|nr:hypothetical protein [Erysipelotrichaceae bacterium]
MADTETSEVKTRRHLVPRVALAFPLVRDTDGHITDVKDPLIILDTEELLNKVMDPKFSQDHKIVRLDTTTFYK